MKAANNFVFTAIRTYLYIYIHLIKALYHFDFMATSTRKTCRNIRKQETNFSSCKKKKKLLVTLVNLLFTDSVINIVKTIIKLYF